MTLWQVLHGFALTVAVVFLGILGAEVFLWPARVDCSPMGASLPASDAIEMLGTFALLAASSARAFWGDSQ